MREEVRSSGTAEPFAAGHAAAAVAAAAAGRPSTSPPPTPAASSAGATSAAAPNNAASIDWLGSGLSSKACSVIHPGPAESHPPLCANTSGSALESSRPTCRPWERGDLLRRLATFKPSSWLAKPKSASSLACARRGWMNIDADKIECETCGARLMFAILASWSPTEVASAGEAFAEQLDTGHDLNCQWRGNNCADSLLQFHQSPSALVGGYKDRCDGLFQFESLPVIAISAIENMRLTRSTQIDRLLSQPASFLSGDSSYKADNVPWLEFAEPETSCGYSQAQKLISLCGWEPRWLPNIQDYEENSTQSARVACSNEFDDINARYSDHKRSSFTASAKKDKGKRPLRDSGRDMRSPLLDCSLCGATVKICDFRTSSRPTRLGSNNINIADTGKKLAVTHGTSAASGINGWANVDGIERDQAEGRDEAATDEGKSLLHAGVDLNLTMAGGLPSSHSIVPMLLERSNDGGMGRDLMIGQPTGSEVGDHAASYESRGPSSLKRNLEEGGSTADKPQHGLQHADSIEGTVIDREGDEVDDGTQDSNMRIKRSRGFDIFDSYPPGRIDSSGAGPSKTLCFDAEMYSCRLEPSKLEGHLVGANTPARDSTRASSVIAMDTVYHTDDSMESVENFPGDVDDIHLPSSSMHRNAEINDALDLNYSNQAQQSTCQAPVGSVAREGGQSSTNEGEEVMNIETATVYVREQFSVGVSGGSVGMGASHEAEIHGIDLSMQRTESIVGDVEPVTELTEILGHTGESAPGPGLMDEFVPEEVGREDLHGDSQDVVSQSIGRADSASKIYGPTKAESKAESVESAEKISNTAGNDSSIHPSLSCNAVIYSGMDASKEEVTQTGKASNTGDTFMDYDSVPRNGLTGTTNGENSYHPGLGEFDPIKQHNCSCPWVNGNVATACCSNNRVSSSTLVPLSGWQRTLDALDSLQSTGHVQNQIVQSESAASLNKDDHVAPGKKPATRASASKTRGKR